MKYLVFDISNMLYRTFFAHKDQSDTTIAGLATHSALMTLNKYFRQYKPDRVVMAFDHSSWRKDYTASELCISQKPYKGNRRKDMSPAQQAKYERFCGHLKEFESLITNHSTIISLAGEKLEADDLIAGFCEAHQNDDITLISSDSDMLQLLRFQNVKIVSPATDKEVTLEEYNHDPKYYLFVKCMRGDSTDYIQSALPRVQSKRLEKAYKDPFERVQLMQEFWIDPKTKTEFKVQDLYEENIMLIDLTQQPDPVRRRIFAVVDEAVKKERKYSHFHLMRYLGKYELEVIAKQLDTFLPLLSQ